MSKPGISLPPEFNAATYFVDRHVAEGRGEKVAIICGDREVTYRQLFELVNQTGNGLKKLGVRPEERVLMLLLDTPEFAAAFFGAIKIGAVPIPVNTLLKPADYQYLLNNSRARVAIVSDLLLSQIEAIPRGELRYLEKVVAVGKRRPDTISFDEMIAQCPRELAAERTSKDDAAFWLYSSGSTGRPKGCVHLQHDMVVSTEHYAKGVLGIAEPDRCFSAAKLFFAYGLGNALYFPLAVGATSILLPGPPKPEKIFEIIQRHRPTLLFSVPSNYARLLEYAEGLARPPDLSSVRCSVSAGEALPASLFERFQQRFGLEILDSIGSTEALHMFIASRPGEIRPGSCGKVVPGFEARIVDENNTPVPAGTIGELLVNCDSTCACYWNDHEKTKATIEGKWLRTGDKFYQDADGYYWHAGRADDMLKVSGMWISPAEVEDVLSGHHAVREVAVVARNDQHGLAKTVACVVLRDGMSASAEIAGELQQFLLEQLPIYKRPHAIEFYAELPRTATGKLQRFKLRAAGQDTALPPSAAYQFR